MAILKALERVEDGNSDEIFEGIPESLGYCVPCGDFYNEVKYVDSCGLTLCKNCCDEEDIDWDKPI